MHAGDSSPPGPRARLLRWAHAHKPASSALLQLRLAALTWTLVGTGLALAGINWSLGWHGVTAAALLGAAAAAGLAKGKLLLARVAHRNGERLASRGDGYCVGGYQSSGGWLLVAGMMALGMVLRASPLPRPWLGLLYAAIGTALLVGSVPLWRRQAEVRTAP